MFHSLNDYLFVRWNAVRPDIPRWKLPFLQFARIAWVLALDMFEGRFTKNAMSLVYKTLQSLVPLLALSFSVLQAFGVHNKLKPFLDRFLVPFGESGVELSNRIIDFVTNMRVGVLGAAGLLILLYTAVTTFQMVQSTFNDIWQVSTKSSFYYRFMIYISLIMVGPVLVFAALGITASFTSASVISWFTGFAPFRALIYVIGLVVPYLIVAAIFTVMYKLIPDTKVFWRPAMIGGLLAGLAWEAAQWAFTSFVASSSKYEAIYSGFAILIVFFIWLYVSWLILLMGAAIVYYLQYPSLIGIRREHSTMSIRTEEKTALAMMAAIGRDYEQGGHSWKLPDLAAKFALPAAYVEHIAEKMEKAGFIVQLERNNGGFVPAAPLDSITVADFQERYRSAGEGVYLSADRIHVPDDIERTIEEARRASDDVLSRLTLRDISVRKDGAVVEDGSVRSDKNG